MTKAIVAAILTVLIFFYVTAMGIFATLAFALPIQLALSRLSALGKSSQRVNAGELDPEIKSNVSDGLGQLTGEFSAIARKLTEREPA